MSNGVDRRAQIDTETVKALLLINGGGAIALLSLLPSILDKDGYERLAYSIFMGVLFLMFGLVFAVIHNRLRRKCSLHYDQHKMKPPKGRLFGIVLWGPTVCCISTVFMWISIGAFFLGGLFVAINGIITLENLKS
ncbi:MAG: hypothetical protein IIA72_24590 [Proteobacteria bacterium]|nr:hypothetical protein [Pseudomonadota bacterium]